MEKDFTEKTTIIISTISSLVCSLLISIITLAEYESFFENGFIGVVLYLVMIAFICFCVSYFISVFTRLKQAKK